MKTWAREKAEELIERKTLKGDLAAGDIEAVILEALGDHHFADNVCCLDAVNDAATRMAQRLQQILKSGAHHGVFGGAEIEAAAQDILAMRASHSTLLSEFMAAHEKAENLFANAYGSTRYTHHSDRSKCKECQIIARAKALQTTTA